MLDPKPLTGTPGGASVVSVPDPAHDYVPLTSFPLPLNCRVLPTETKVESATSLPSTLKVENGTSNLSTLIRAGGASVIRVPDPADDHMPLRLDGGPTPQPEIAKL